MELGLVFLLVVTSVSGCGVPSYWPNTSRVVNGEEARLYSWPWQVSLESFYPTCGGTLIAPDWVLTAAHCITFHTYRVVLAEHDMDKEEGPEQSIMVAKMFIHPKWNDNCVSCGNDIALLKLEKSADLNDKAGGPRATRLQQALLPVVDHSVCSQSDWWGSSAKTTMVCAGGDSKSACHGDSGGPLNCKGRDNRWYVEGVTSFVDGRGCNTPKKPTVFTRVASFIPWISETMAQN
ncbi:chymotrypsin-like elastase family member 3B isoform X2 [Xiphophorus maculatus]|uniref:chymotrypsin-like elastase family member 3B isoform X2 n=1 Tax=Xiphophorus maculatus TaxID=8083 RepID=UPI000C6CEA6B|nr:chymotrypsin-like elastase family member 3B isoform X2 [Xiphophorus maculatus]